MGAAFGLLGLSPDAFWSMTPKELSAGLRARCGGSAAAAGPPSRRDLQRMLERYPDTPGH